MAFRDLSIRRNINQEIDEMPYNNNLLDKK